MYLQKLIDICVAEGKSEPFLCIKDLAENGLSLDRFTSGEHRPNRSEATLFLAASCKRMGLAPETYRDWLIDYSVDVLSGVSSSSASTIRHSTKSSIQFTHRSDVTFSCNCQHNVFKAHCSSDCPIYRDMGEIRLLNIEFEKTRVSGVSQQVREEYIPDPESLPVTKRYRKQFDEAVVLIAQQLAEGHTKKEISAFLNEKGYKTITGGEWKPAAVSRIAVEKGLTPKRNARLK